MDAGKQISSAAVAVASVAAARQVAAPDAIGLLTPKGGLTATDITPSTLPRASTAEASSASAPVAPTIAELSPGAQLLLKLLGGGSSPSVPLPAAAPLLTEPPVALMDGPLAIVQTGKDTGSSAGALIAHALQSGIEHSGLFYESHLADWVAGQRSLTAIRTEPQAALRADSATAMVNADGNAGNGSPGPAAAGTAGTTSLMNAMSSIVQSQLDVIDSGLLRWQGELWPGMPIDLRLQRESADDESADARQNKDQAAEQCGRRWQASLITILPSLGKISTRISLQDDRLSLKLDCDYHATASVLQSAAPSLAGTLQASGLSLQAFASNVEQAR